VSGDWRLLLSRALDGDELSAAEAEALADALDAQGAGREAAALLGFDTALRERLAPPGVAVSRERLLAKAALREKALGQRPLPRRPSARFRGDGGCGAWRRPRRWRCWPGGC